jgi:hypothetical protein
MHTQQSKAEHDLSNDEESRQLRDILAKAIRERKCVYHGALLMVALFIL